MKKFIGIDLHLNNSVVVDLSTPSRNVGGNRSATAARSCGSG